MTIEQWQDFKLFFATNHNELDKKLPTKSLVNGEPFVTQPAKLSDAEYDSFNSILEKWRTDNSVY